MNIKEAFWATPGPKSRKEMIILFAKGIFMGCADIVPGVSGGTIALLTGIYSQLLHAVSSVNDGIKHLCRFDFSKAFAAIHLRFLINLLAGIGSAVILLAHLMHYLLEYQPIPTWGLFFGLVAASILIIGKTIRRMLGEGGFCLLLGTILGYFVVGMIPVQTPESLWFVTFSGMVAICAMILPGISGSFLLLILGKYQYITGAIKNPFDPANILILIFFGCGCVIGLLGFSKLLSYLLDRFQNPTMAILTGLMLGSLRKIWPWKETVESIVIRGKTHVLATKNILPSSADTETLLALALAAAGFLVVVFIHRLSHRSDLTTP